MAAFLVRFIAIASNFDAEIQRKPLALAGIGQDYVNPGSSSRNLGNP